MAYSWFNDIKVNWVFLKFGAPHVRVEDQLAVLSAHLAAGVRELDPEPQPWRNRMTVSILSALVTYNAAASLRDEAERKRAQMEALETIQTDGRTGGKTHFCDPRALISSANLPKQTA